MVERMGQVSGELLGPMQRQFAERRRPAVPEQGQKLGWHPVGNDAETRPLL